MYIRTLAKSKKVPWINLFPKACPEGILFIITALDMLEKLLSFDPMQRITVEEALEHEYLAAYHDSEDEVQTPNPSLHIPTFLISLSRSLTVSMR